MTARALPLVLLVLFLGLLGCRDTLVDEPLPPGSEAPPADTATQNLIYLKGPAELRIGETRNYRAEPLDNAVSYRWALAGGTGVVSGVPVHEINRLYDITGVEAGGVTLLVQAFDANNAIIGTGSRSIVVLR